MYLTHNSCPTIFFVCVILNLIVVLIMSTFDCHAHYTARILRGIRIAARLGFQFSRETSHFLKEFSDSLLRLDKVYLCIQFILFS